MDTQAGLVHPRRSEAAFKNVGVACNRLESPQGPAGTAVFLVDEAYARGGLAPWQARKVDKYLRQNLEHPLPIKDLAATVSLSVSHFCRAFKTSFGTTPRSYIIRLRVELAQSLMLGTMDPLSQIALSCGMADQAHLSKLFRRELGQTPSSWRRRNFTGACTEQSGRGW